jgi:hypothetical protein
MRRFVKEEDSQRRMVKFEIFIFHPFDILPTLLPSVFLLGKLQVSCLLVISLLLLLL